MSTKMTLKTIDKNCVEDSSNEIYPANIPRKVIPTITPVANIVNQSAINAMPLMLSKKTALCVFMKIAQFRVLQ